MIQVVYQLFNALRFKKKGFTPIFSQEEPEQTEEDPNKIVKPSQINISDDNYNSLMQDVANNLGNKNYQTTVNNQKYDLNKAKNFLLNINTKNISKSEAQELHNNLIKPDVSALKKSKGKNKNIRLSILNILENIESSLFEGYYSNCKDLSEESIETGMPKLENEESVA